MVKQTINKKRLKEFITYSNFEVFFRDNKIVEIGLKYGESIYLKQLGFKRNEQISFLDWLKNNPTELKVLLGLEKETHN